MADARSPLGDTDDILACPGLGRGAPPSSSMADTAGTALGRAAIAYARTVLTMGHDAELLLPGRRAGQVRYVEDAGKPYLLLRQRLRDRPDEGQRVGRTRLLRRPRAAAERQPGPAVRV